MAKSVRPGEERCNLHGVGGAERGQWNTSAESGSARRSLREQLSAKLSRQEVGPRARAGQPSGPNMPTLPSSTGAGSLAPSEEQAFKGNSITAANGGGGPALGASGASATPQSMAVSSERDKETATIETGPPYTQLQSQASTTLLLPTRHLVKPCSLLALPLVPVDLWSLESLAFDGDVFTFIRWKELFLAFSRHHGFYDALTTDDRPLVGQEEGYPKAPDTEAIFRSRQALFALLETMPDEQWKLKLIREHSVPRAWKCLDEHFSQRASIEDRKCLLELSACTMESGTDPSLFFSEVDRIVGKLSALGYETSDSEIHLRLLDALPDEYSQEVQTLLSLEAIGRAEINRWTIEYAALSAYRIMTSRRSEKKNSGHRARAEKARGGKDGRRGESKPQVEKGGQGPRRCYRCNSKSHLAAECPATVIPSPDQV